VASKKDLGRMRRVAADVERAAKIVGSYVCFKAIAPGAKHREELLPLLAEMYGLSASRVDQILGECVPAPERRQWVRFVAGVYGRIGVQPIAHLADYLKSPAGNLWHKRIEAEAGAGIAEAVLRELRRTN
jgi:hypothetical protein